MCPAILRVGTRVLAPVAVLHQVAPHADLVIDDLPFGTIVGPPDGGPARGLGVGWAGDGELTGVHRAVKAGHRGPGRQLPAFGDLWGHGRSRNRDRPHRWQRDRLAEHPDHVGRHADHHGSPCRRRGLEAVLRAPVRFAQHDQCGAQAQAVQAHPADALGQRRHREDAVVLGDVQPRGKALEGHLLQPRGERGQLGHAGRARAQGDLDDARRIRCSDRRRWQATGWSAQRFQFGARDDQPRLRFAQHPAHLVLSQRKRQRHDERAHLGDRKLQRDVLPDVRQPHTDHVTRAHASGR